MNVEIGAEAARNSQKRNIYTELPLQCIQKGKIEFYIQENRTRRISSWLWLHETIKSACKANQKAPCSETEECRCNQDTIISNMVPIKRGSQRRASKCQPDYVYTHSPFTFSGFTRCFLTHNSSSIHKLFNVFFYLTVMRNRVMILSYRD
jgi:hypothetical protein